MFNVNLEVVGVDKIENLSDPRLWDEMKNKLLHDIGASTVRSIQNQIRIKDWKNGVPESLLRSVKYNVEPDAVTVRVGSTEPGRHNYAVNQEYGVERHEMRYLLKAKRPIPLMIGSYTRGKNVMGVMIFRKATERWMGVEHVVNSPTQAITGKRAKNRLLRPIKPISWEHPPYQATGWVHPGFPGKFFFRDGVREAMNDINKNIEGITLRVANSDPYLNLDYPGER